MEPSDRLDFLLALIVVLGALVVLLAIWLWDHLTFIRSFKQTIRTLSSAAGHSPPAPANPYPLPTPGLLQALFPEDLFASEILPSHSVRRDVPLPACQLFNQAGEQPVYWKLATQQGRLALLAKFEEEELDEAEQNGWDLSACENPKLDFSRRTFLLPYQLARRHRTLKSCRVIIQSRVWFGKGSESICV